MSEIEDGGMRSSLADIDSVRTDPSMRLSIAKNDATRTLTWSGGLVVCFSILTFLLDRSGGFGVHAADIAVGVLLIFAGTALRHPRVPAAIVPWAFAGLMTLLVVAFLFEIWLLPSSLAMAYVLLVMCAFGPPTLAWEPFIVAASIMVIASAVVATSWAGGLWHDWTLASIAAVIIGGVLLRVRLRSVAALEDAADVVQRLATTDQLTGMLNRHGLTLHLDALNALARRLGQPIFVAFVDIDGLKTANDTRGHDFGDEVITSAATATVACVRENDLVARWGGDELIVVGLGEEPDVDRLRQRIEERVAASGIDLTGWPGQVSIGMASGRPDEHGIDRLIHEADVDMYRRRLAR